MKKTKDYLLSWDLKQNALTKKLKEMSKQQVVKYLTTCLYTEELPDEKPYALGIMARFYQRRFITEEHLSTMTINDLRKAADLILGLR